MKELTIQLGFLFLACQIIFMLMKLKYASALLGIFALAAFGISLHIS